MPNDHETARELALAAGELLLALRADNDAPSPGALRDLADRRAHEFLLAELARRCPGDTVLSEEDDDESDVTPQARRLWIVDPLDGTREYGQPGRSDWAVHVALVVDGELAAGAVTIPTRSQVFATDPAPLVPSRVDRAPRIAVSRSRPSREVRELAVRARAELVPMGSAGVKAMAVVLGDVDVYAHSGGQHAWDSAAPVAVAHAAGLHASRLDGSPLRYGAGASTWVPDLLICRRELAAEMLTHVAEIMA